MRAEGYGICLADVTYGATRWRIRQALVLLVACSLGQQEAAHPTSFNPSLMGAFDPFRFEPATLDRDSTTVPHPPSSALQHFEETFSIPASSGVLTEGFLASPRSVRVPRPNKLADVPCLRGVEPQGREEGEGGGEKVRMRLRGGGEWPATKTHSFNIKTGEWSVIDNDAEVSAHVPATRFSVLKQGMVLPGREFGERRR